MTLNGQGQSADRIIFPPLALALIMPVPCLDLSLVGLGNVMVLAMVATRPGSPQLCLTVPGREGDPDSDRAGELWLRLGWWLWLVL